MVAAYTVGDASPDDLPGIEQARRIALTNGRTKSFDCGLRGAQAALRTNGRVWLRPAFGFAQGRPEGRPLR